MEFTNGEDRVLFLKVDGNYMPVGCLTGNSISETSEMISTTTRDNDGWSTSRPLNQNYTISFDGLQVNTTVAGGTFSIMSYDKLKILKRTKQRLDWKIQGTTFPVVDYGKCYITELSEASNVGELLTFSGALVGFGIPRTAGLTETVLNNGNPEIIITTDETSTLILKTQEV
jgi:hypothetical protein